MEDIEPVRTLLDWRARAIVSGAGLDRARGEEWRCHAEMDRAQLVVLVEQDLLPHESARRYLAAIDTLIAQDFAPLCDRPAPRGSYLLYEQWLLDAAGESIGSAAHPHRSRHDADATALRLRLRAAYVRLVRELLRLLAVLIRRAARYAGTTMPLDTRHQAAHAITYGQYLAGVAAALFRDLQGIEDACRDLDRCPPGAGMAAGTAAPNGTERAARLLGFRHGMPHAIDAGASRDLVLRLLAATTVLGLTLSRLAADLRLWSTAEYNPIAFRNELVGSSSALPQDRMPFLLEHIKRIAAAPLGAFAAATMAMHAAPPGTTAASGVTPLWNALRDTADAVLLARLMVAGTRPQLDRMRPRAANGFTSATELANRLVREAGWSFRQAHQRIGELVTIAARRGDSLEVLAAELFASLGLRDGVMVDADAIASRAAYHGAPSAVSLGPLLATFRTAWIEAARRLTDRSRQWREAKRDLASAIQDLLAEQPLAPEGEGAVRARCHAD
jgi:argininosuccinate lyase